MVELGIACFYPMGVSHIATEAVVGYEVTVALNSSDSPDLVQDALAGAKMPQPNRYLLGVLAGAFAYVVVFVSVPSGALSGFSAVLRQVYVKADPRLAQLRMFWVVR
jgi:hypothetical protein